MMHKVQEKYRKTREKDRVIQYSTSRRIRGGKQYMEILPRQQAPMAFNSLFDPRERECGGTRSALPLTGKSPEGNNSIPLPNLFLLPSLPGCQVYGLLSPVLRADDHCYWFNPAAFWRQGLCLLRGVIYVGTHSLLPFAHTANIKESAVIRVPDDDPERDHTEPVIYGTGAVTSPRNAV